MSLLPAPLTPMPAVSLPDLLADLREPPAAFRPIMFWMWNADIEPEKMRRQLGEIRRAGCGGVCIHPMPDGFRKRDFIAGMETEYLSDRFFAWIRLAVAEAARLGLQVWLYDEGGWPSGHALGKVAQGHPEFHGWTLRLVEGKAQAVPQGYPADLMNPLAVRQFIDLTHERYLQAVGQHFGRTVTAMFTDEMRVGGSLSGESLPWTPELPGIFRERKGYDLAPLEALFDRSPATARLRYDYTEVWYSLFREAYLEQIRAWCREHGLASVGHFPGEDEFAGPVRHGFGDVLGGLAAFDIPAVDAIWRQIFPGRPFQDFPRLAGSVARQQGGRYACTESFAVYGWGLTPAQMRWVTEHQFVRGINLMAPMCAAYRAQGSGMVNTSSHLAWGNPLWPHFGHYACYAARLGWLLAQPRRVETAVYLPIRGLWADPENPGPGRSTEALARALCERQVDFEYVGDEALQAAGLDDQGMLHLGEATYRRLLLPHTPALPVDTLVAIQGLAEAGFPVLSVGRPAAVPDRPEDIPAIADAWRQVEVLASETEMASALPPTLRVHPAWPALRARVVYGQGWEAAFLLNESGDILRFRLESPPGSTPYRLDLETGAMSPLSLRAGRIPLRLAAWESAVVLFDHSGETAGSRVPAPQQNAVLRAVNLRWEMRPREQHRVDEAGIHVETPASALSPRERAGVRGFAQDPDPHFSGSIEYLARRRSRTRQTVTLDFGPIRHVLEVWVNGRPVGVRVWPPYRVEVTLEPGVNTIRAVVTNTLANEFARPEVKEMMRGLGWHNGYRRRAEAFESEETRSSHGRGWE